jgi:hypothetical protein
MVALDCLEQIRQFGSRQTVEEIRLCVSTRLMLRGVVLYSEPAEATVWVGMRDGDVVAYNCRMLCVFLLAYSCFLADVCVVSTDVTVLSPLQLSEQLCQRVFSSAVDGSGLSFDQCRVLIESLDEVSLDDVRLQCTQEMLDLIQYHRRLIEDTGFDVQPRR